MESPCSVEPDSFFKFMHPSVECKCCNPELIVAHPSEQCVCCIVDWEKSGKKESIGDWLKSKFTNRDILDSKKLPASKSVKLESKSHNIIINNGNTLVTDAALLFGKVDSEEHEPVEVMEVGTTFADLLVKFGIFPSKGQARKSGWDKPIPDGWTEIQVGKMKHKFFIWNPSNEWA